MEFVVCLWTWVTTSLALDHFFMLITVLATLIGSLALFLSVFFVSLLAALLCHRPHRYLRLSTWPARTFRSSWSGV